MMTTIADDTHQMPSPGTWTEVLAVFLRLGLTSFGGPVAHLGYFREEFVAKRKWLDDRTYADIVALCQFLPGPASSQVGIAVGLSRAGYAGALAAWTGFTLPSAIAMVVGSEPKLASWRLAPSAFSSSASSRPKTSFESRPRNAVGTPSLARARAVLNGPPPGADF